MTCRHSETVLTLLIIVVCILDEPRYRVYAGRVLSSYISNIPQMFRAKLIFEGPFSSLANDTPTTILPETTSSPAPSLPNVIFVEPKAIFAKALYQRIKPLESRIEDVTRMPALQKSTFSVTEPQVEYVTGSPTKETCLTSRDCHRYHNTRCKDGFCQCWEGFVWLSETKKCQQLVGIKEKCNSTSQCDTKDAICLNGFCQCSQRYDRQKNRCVSYDEAAYNDTYHIIVVCCGVILCVLLCLMTVCVLKSRPCHRDRDGEWEERRPLLPRYDQLEELTPYPPYLLINGSHGEGNPIVDKPPLYETVVSEEEIPEIVPITDSPPPSYSDLLEEYIPQENVNIFGLRFSSGRERNQLTAETT